MGIGYASINSITGEIEGTVIANVQNDVFITNVEYVSDIDANINTSKIEYYIGTMMQSTVELSDTNSETEIKYKVTVYNNSLNNYPFLDVLYDTESTEFYDNENIIFEIDPSGFKVGDTINAKETKEIYITFKYKNGIIPENTVLNSYINFRIAEPNRLVVAGDVASTGNYLGSTITKNKIEAISFKLGKEEPEGTVASFDASEKQDESIIGYYTDVDGNGLYELTFLSEEKIAANKNGRLLFENLTSLTSIEFDNFSTWGVTTMYAMFYNCSGLTTLDLTNFDTSQVTTMKSMFERCSGLTTLDVSSFDTSKVTNMYQIFYNCSGLTTLDVSSFDTSQVTTMYAMLYACSKLITLDVSNFNTSKVADMTYMFTGCSKLKTIYVKQYDETTKTGWKLGGEGTVMFGACYSLVGGNGTKYHAGYTGGARARIDTAETPGYFTNILDKTE